MTTWQPPKLPPARQFTPSLEGEFTERNIGNYVPVSEFLFHSSRGWQDWDDDSIRPQRGGMTQDGSMRHHYATLEAKAKARQSRAGQVCPLGVGDDVILKWRAPEYASGKASPVYIEEDPDTDEYQVYFKGIVVDISQWQASGMVDVRVETLEGQRYFRTLLIWERVNDK